MFAIYAINDGHFQMATWETFEDINEALAKVEEMKPKAEKGVRFFIEVS